MQLATDVARWALRSYAASSRLMVLAAATAIAVIVPALALRNALQLELTRSADLGISWSGLAAAPADLQRRGLTRLSDLGAVLAIGAAAVSLVTLWALCAARAVTRRLEVHVRRSVGASRRQLLSSAAIEGVVIAAIAAGAGTTIGLIAAHFGFETWPGRIGVVHYLAPTLAACAVAVVAFISAVIPGVDMSRIRPTIPVGFIPPGLAATTLQLGVSCAILLVAGQIARNARQMLNSRPSAMSEGQILQIDTSGIPAERSRQLGEFISRSASARLSDVTSVTSPGALDGLGVVDVVITDCGRCSQGGIATPLRPVAASVSAISADSFGAMNLSIVEGRPFTDKDDWNAPRVVVVNRALALAHFENGEAIGRRVRIGLGRDNWFQVVGVIDNRRSVSIGGALQPNYAVYTNVLQTPPSTVDVLVRRRADSKPVQALLPTLAGRVRHVTSEENWWAERAGPLKWFSAIIYLGGSLVFFLALLGTAAVMHLWISELTQEMALRRAVGARRRQVFLYTFSRVAAVAGLGVSIGFVLGDLASIPLESITPGIPAIDLTSGLRIGIAFLFAGWAGAFLPTWRVSRADPAGALST